MVIHAPLLPHGLTERGVPWYDEVAVAAGLDSALQGGLIDLLLVAGTGFVGLTTAPARSSSSCRLLTRGRRAHLRFGCNR